MKTQENKLTQLIELMKEQAITPNDKALYHLLARWENELPELNDYFHKSFRQVDNVDLGNGGHTDMAIWHLLGQSHLFWRLFEEAVK